MYDGFMLTFLQAFYYRDLNVFALLCNTWQKTMSLGWQVCDVMCVFFMQLEIFPRFNSNVPGKCLIASGFVVTAMIILFYALLFSY